MQMMRSRLGDEQNREDPQERQKKRGGGGVIDGAQECPVSPSLPTQRRSCSDLSRASQAGLAFPGLTKAGLKESLSSLRPRLHPIPSHQATGKHRQPFLKLLERTYRPPDNTMPPKQQKKKAAQPSRSGLIAPSVIEDNAAESTPDDVLLLPIREEYERICQNLEGLRGQRAQLRAQYEFLQQEAQDLQNENREFLGYLAKHVQRRQGVAVSLNENNQELLRKIKEQHQESLARSQQQEATLREQLLQKEVELARLSAELEGLRGVQALQQEQTSRIRELQRELAAAQKQRTQRLEAAKAQVLKEKAAHEQEAEQQLESLSRQMQRLAMHCLRSHCQTVRKQNQELRKELQQLTQQVQELQVHKHRLQRQKQRLSREHGCLQDLASLRGHLGSGCSGLALEEL